MQLDLQDCGAGVISYLVKYYNGRISIEKLRQMTYTNKNGTNMYMLKECLIKLGFKTVGYKIKFDNINKYQLPLVAQIVKNNMKHFVVILKIKKHKIYLFDPSIGIISYKIDQFITWFSGYILTAYPYRQIVYEESLDNFKNFIKELLNRYKKNILILMILTLILSLLMFTDTYYLKLLVDRINFVDYSFFIKISLLFAGLAITRQLISYFNNWYLNKFLNNFDKSLMNHLHNKLFCLPMSFYEQRTTGEIITRLNAVNDFRTLLMELIGAIGVNLIFISLTVIVLFLINPLLCLFCLILVVMILLIYSVFRNKLKFLMYQLQDAEAMYQNKLIEYINRMKTIFNLKINKYISMELNKQYEVLIKSNQHYFNVINMEILFKNLTICLFNFIVFIFSGLLIKQGDITIGTLVQINTIILYFVAPLERIFNLEGLIRSCHVAYLRIKEIMDIDDVSYQNYRVNNINIHNLSYAYNGIDNILENVHLKIKKKDKILVTGQSGVGKSTLFKLVMGYDNNFTGEININYRNEKTERMIYLSQGEFLFSGTIFDNIVLDYPVDKTKLTEILKVCHIDLDLNTFVLADGSQLSGGEGQRIKLARTLYRDFDVLILDEALSEVDHSLETEILELLLKHYQDKTIIYISHRPNIKKIFKQHINVERSCYGN